MRRKPCVDVRTWHVFGRGARRLALFYEDADYRQYLLFLREALILSGCLLFGYALMGNHYHLILRGTQEQLSVCMQRLNWRYALFHNDRHRMGGHVFDGPYRNYPQRSLRWLLWRLAYVFLNPVKAGLCSRPEEYPWSGYLSFLGQPGSPLEVNPLPEFEVAPPGFGDVRELFGAMVEEQRLRGRDHGSHTPTAGEIQADQFDWIRREADERARRFPDVDPTSLALWWGQDCGVPPRIMAKALGLPSSDLVRYRIRCFRKRMEQDPLLAERLSL